MRCAGILSGDGSRAAWKESAVMYNRVRAASLPCGLSGRQKLKRGFMLPHPSGTLLSELPGMNCLL